MQYMGPNQQDQGQKNHFWNSRVKSCRFDTELPAGEFLFSTEKFWFLDCERALRVPRWVLDCKHCKCPGEHYGCPGVSKPIIRRSFHRLVSCRCSQGRNLVNRIIFKNHPSHDLLFSNADTNATMAEIFSVLALFHFFSTDCSSQSRFAQPCNASSLIFAKQQLNKLSPCFGLTKNTNVQSLAHF